MELPLFSSAGRLHRLDDEFLQTIKAFLFDVVGFDLAADGKKPKKPMGNGGLT